MAKKNYEIALATVISTWGSSPRQVGGQMAINKIGEISWLCIRRMSRGFCDP